jgi:hypothetical protein
VPPDLREAMKLVPGDVLAMNVEHGLLWAVKLTPSMVATRAQVAKIFDSLFPDKADADASE